MRRRDGLLLDQLHAFIFAVAEYQPHPLGKIACVRARAARRRLRIGVALDERRPFPVHRHMQLSAVGVLEKVGMAGAGRAHAERLVKFLLGDILP
jgi:hypothetical protein